MTTEEAIRRVKRWKFINKEGCEDNGLKEIVIEALEYREPKKPVYDHCQSWVLLRAIYVCPTCGLSYDRWTKPKFCPNCGQAIDWSDKE